MRNGLAKAVRLSALVAMAGTFSFAVVFSNCGGSGGDRAGTAGTSGGGAGGATGTGGTSGGGTGGVARNVCTPKPDLICTPTPITLPDGHVTEFSPQEWNGPAGKYCNTSGLQGSIFGYQGGPTPDAGPVSLSSPSVDAAAGNYKLAFTVGSAGYAGAGLSFEGCVDVTAFNAIRFNAWVAGGDLTGCNFKVQLQTFEQRPLSQSPPGGCDPDAGASCYRFPASPNLSVTTTPTPITIPFADLTTSYTHMTAFAGQLVGLQWQLESGSGVDGGEQPSCMVEIRVDDINFVTQ